MKPLKPIRFQMIGGFLGAGKTTTIAKLASSYRSRGLQVGIVTNDQAEDLVDTGALRSQGFRVGEVAGACFCCSFDDLVSTMRALTLDEMPDVIIAEPVGSCTDLVATVSEPIRRFYEGEFIVAPYAVLLKPEHGLRILAGQGGGFSPQAEYIFLKQIEEAEIVVINKIDKLDENQRRTLREAIERKFAGKPVVESSAKTGQGMEHLESALNEVSDAPKAFMDVDYDIYAAGEAELGWLNATFDANTDTPIELDRAVRQVTESIQQQVATTSAEVAHMKVLARSVDASSVANLVSSDSAVEVSISSAGTVASQFTLVVNARIATDPEQLATCVQKGVAESATQLGIDLRSLTQRSLSPGRPVPTHSLR